MKIEVSNGEIADKVSILLIKKEKLDNQQKIVNVTRELEEIQPILETIIKIDSQEFVQLKKINEKLWEIEDKIRDKERKKQFDSEFIELARSVYITNDERSIVKRQINEVTGSRLIEEKSYKEY